MTYQMRANKAPMLFELAMALNLLVPEVCLEKFYAIYSGVTKSKKTDYGSL
jgi:hypothetical protein